MLNTYNLDAVSPRITNKNSSHKICGEAEQKKNFFRGDLKINYAGTFLVCKKRDCTSARMC